MNHDEGGFWMSYYYCLKYANDKRKPACFGKIRSCLEYVMMLVILSGICGSKTEEKIQQSRVQNWLQYYVAKYPQIDQFQLQQLLSKLVAKQRREYKYRFWFVVFLGILMIGNMILR